MNDPGEASWSCDTRPATTLVPFPMESEKYIGLYKIEGGGRGCKHREGLLMNVPREASSRYGARQPRVPTPFPKGPAGCVGLYTERGGGLTRAS